MKKHNPLTKDYKFYSLAFNKTTESGKRMIDIFDEYKSYPHEGITKMVKKAVFQYVDSAALSDSQKNA